VVWNEGGTGLIMKIFDPKYNGRSRGGWSTQDVLIVILAIVVIGLFAVFAIQLRARESKPKLVVGSGAVIPTETNREVEAFTLTDQDGHVFDSSTLSGNYWIADFIFTNCPGPCPIMTTEMAKIQADYAARSDLRFVSISVDPKRDTPAKLREFGEQYGADFSRWTFLTGEFEEVQHLAKDVFLLAFSNPEEVTTQGKEPIEKTTGGIIHSSRLVLVGPNGKIVSWFNGTDEAGPARLRETLNGVFGRADEPGGGGG